MIVFTRLILTILLPCIFVVSHGQQLPLYSQFVFNPYLSNPSLLSASGRTEANLVYRQQWTGLTDGPTTIQADFQHPINARMAIGMMMNNDKTILLSKTSVLFSYAYALRFGDSHRLTFGLSAGMFMNRIQIEDVDAPDINDPALTNTSDNNWSFNSQFGVSYTVSNFSFGVALLQLLENPTFGESGLAPTKFNQFDNFLAIATYRVALSEYASLQPNVAYRIYANDMSTYEGSLVFGFKNLSIGAGYRQHFGPLTMLRVQWSNLQIGYAYDFPSTEMAKGFGGTHEVHLKFLFGKEVTMGDNSIYKNYNKWYRKETKRRKARRSRYY